MSEEKVVEVLPEKIKVGNIEYKIDRETHEGYHGFHVYSGNERRIIIDPSLTGDNLKNVFFHEIVHAILYQIGADEENENEMLVQGLANEIQKLFDLKIWPCGTK